MKQRNRHPGEKPRRRKRAATPRRKEARVSVKGPTPAETHAELKRLIVQDRERQLAAVIEHGLTYRMAHEEFLEIAMVIHRVHPHPVVFVDRVGGGVDVYVKDEHVYKAAVALAGIVDGQE